MTWYGDIRARAPRGQYFEPVELVAIEVYQRRLARLGIEMDDLDWELICQLDKVWMECVPKIGDSAGAKTPGKGAA